MTLNNYDHLRPFMFRTVLLGILLFHYCASSEKAPNYTFMHQATSAPSISYYDYIIVGGGTAGCPLAATLSEKYNVLLLERGDSPYGNPNITNIEASASLPSDTSPSSPSQRFVSEDGVENARARVLGGGTCINSGFYSRAESSYVKEAGWDGKVVNESYHWVEKKIVSRPIIRQWQSAIIDGLLEAGVTPYNNFTYDHLVGTKVGGTLFDANGKRHTAANLLEYANPHRLTVLLHANVERILFATKGKSKPLARGISFRDGKGNKHKAYLKNGSKNEVIISAGSLGSPQLLMLSGIGPSEHLKSHNISLVLNQPFVGQGMKDNPMNFVFVESPIPVELSLVQIVGITGHGNYIEAASTDFRGGGIMEKVTGPISEGHLELTNLDPTHNPRVTFNYLQAPEDLRKCVNGMKVIGKVLESKAFSKFKYENVTFKALLNIDQNTSIDVTSLERVCKETVRTIYHYHGGCRVGRVVDQNYKVIGVQALRVLDGSTFDYSPGTNPQATLLMLGRYMGLKIHKERITHS